MRFATNLILAAGLVSSTVLAEVNDTSDGFPPKPPESDLVLNEPGINGCWWTDCRADHSPFVCAENGRTKLTDEPCLIGNGTDSGMKFECCEDEPQITPEATNKISLEEFNKACGTKGGSGGSTLYSNFIKSLKRAKISENNKVEQAKYLAHTIWETLAFRQLSEVFCLNKANEGQCRKAYGSGPNGVIYYGRGCLQLSHDYNYRGCSQSLFGNPNVLLNNPERVAKDNSLAWESAAWFWAVNVHDNTQTFGTTLKKINGQLECDGGSAGANMWKRCDHYREILAICKIHVPKDRTADCYCKA